jgi:hypothetical protein
LVRRLAGVGATISAITGLLETTAGLLRQLVQVAGWSALLVASVGLFFHPHLSIGYLATPGGGALAVLQGFIRMRGRPVAAVLADEERVAVGELIAEAGQLPAIMLENRMVAGDCSGGRADAESGGGAASHV